MNEEGGGETRPSDMLSWHATDRLWSAITALLHLAGATKKCGRLNTSVLGTETRAGSIKGRETRTRTRTHAHAHARAHAYTHTCTNTDINTHRHKYKHTH